MKYEYAIRDYDRTPEGNIPKKYYFFTESDLQAFAIAFYNIHHKEATDDEIIQNLIEENILDEDCIDKPSYEILDILQEKENENIDPSDTFIFYIYNLDEDNYVYENDYCDVEDWIYDLVMNGEWDPGIYNLAMNGEWDPEYAQTFIDNGWDYDFLLKMIKEDDE